VDGKWVKVSGTNARYIGSRQGSDYVRKKPKGKFIAPTNYSLLEQSDRTPQGTFLLRRVSDNGIHTGSMGSISNQVWNNLTFINWVTGEVDPGHSRTFPTSLTSAAQAKAWARLKNGNVNFGQAFAERKQTADLVSTNIGRIIQGVRKIRRNPRVLRDIVKGGNTIVNKLPDWVIETVFGWKPLVSDIHGAINELEGNLGNDAYWKVTAVGKAARVAKTMGVIRPYGDDGGALKSPDCNVTLDTLHGCHVRIDAMPSKDYFVKASSLGLTNPLSLAWELMPWSFAIDWCLPLGQYFDNLDAPLGWDILGMSTSNFTKQTLQRQGIPAPTDSNFKYISDWSSRYRYIKLDRNKNVVMPWSIAPRFKDPFSSKQRVLTMLGLLGQIAGRKPVRHLH
jgi:hypothetical protein